MMYRLQRCEARLISFTSNLSLPQPEETERNTLIGSFWWGPHSNVPLSPKLVLGQASRLPSCLDSVSSSEGPAGWCAAASSQPPIWTLQRSYNLCVNIVLTLQIQLQTAPSWGPALPSRTPQTHTKRKMLCSQYKCALRQGLGCFLMTR